MEPPAGASARWYAAIRQSDFAARRAPRTRPAAGGGGPEVFSFFDLSLERFMRVGGVVHSVCRVDAGNFMVSRLTHPSRSHGSFKQVFSQLAHGMRSSAQLVWVYRHSTWSPPLSDLVLSWGLLRAAHSAEEPERRIPARRHRLLLLRTKAARLFLSITWVAVRESRNHIVYYCP